MQYRTVMASQLKNASKSVAIGTISRTNCFFIYLCESLSVVEGISSNIASPSDSFDKYVRAHQRWIGSFPYRKRDRANILQVIGEFGRNAELAVISLLGGASDESKQALENIQDNTPGESPDDGTEGRQEGIEDLCRWQAVPVTQATNLLHLTIFSDSFWMSSSAQSDCLPPAAKRLSG